MGIPKPVAIAILAIVAVLAVGLSWYLTAGRSGSAGGQVPAHAYPQAQPNQSGVEAYGVQPPSDQSAPSVSIPLPGSK
jgi:hypothetical protein